MLVSSTWWMKTSRLPSGDQVGSWLSAVVVSRCSSEPSAFDV
jgi:hypothetical protein